MENNKSRYFELNNNKNEKFSLSEYLGWSGLLVMKLDFFKDTLIQNQLITSKYFDISDKEKIIVLVSGSIEIKLDNKVFSLKEFDAINLYGENSEYEINCIENSQVFIISSKNLTPQKKQPIFFNFKKDINPKDIWGGQCISRIFFGENLNLVLFDLKPGFKFHDKGHENEQITWVIKGDMDFYVKDLKKNLKPNVGVDIGPFDSHGGVSNGAMGFDAFYPKREEEKYQKIN